MEQSLSKGFTLIELLIVIAIIATLAATLIPNLLQARQKGHLSAAQSFIRNTVSVVESQRDQITGSVQSMNGADCTNISQGYLLKPASISTCTISASGADYTITVNLTPGTTQYNSIQYSSTSATGFSFQ
jgi:type IV pilus assembly protein PilA